MKKSKKGYKFVPWLFGKEIKIPVEWKKTTLSKNCIAKAEYGASVSSIEKNTNLPRYIRITDINDDGSLRYSEWKSISEKDAKHFILNEADVLFARTGATVGKTYLHHESNNICAFAGYLIRFKPDNRNLNSKFLFYLTHSKLYFMWLLSIQTWGVQPNVNAEQYSIMPILLPPPHEQKQIASILSGVDSLLEQTQKVTESAQKVKKGLMQKLLTRGISHKKFKKAEWYFGKDIKIPEEWSVNKLSSSCKKIKDIVAGPFGSNLVVSDYMNEGVPIIRLQNIERNTFINKNIQFINNTKSEELNYHSYVSGDLVLAKLGDPIGKTCKVPDDFPNGIVVADVVRIRIDITKSSQDFIEYVLNSKLCEIQYNKEKIGTTRPRVNLEQIRNLQFLTPPLQEQTKIASILSGVDASDYVRFIINVGSYTRLAILLILFTTILHHEFYNTEKNIHSYHNS